MKAKRTKHKEITAKLGAGRQAIEAAKLKYGDSLALIHDVDRKPGNPTLWRSDCTRMIFYLALLGMTEFEMATVIGISEVTFGVWKRKHPEFQAALTKGKIESVACAAHALYRVGIGYECESVKIIPNRVKEYDPDTGKVIKESTEIIEHPYTKKYPPNTTALLKFLAARYPEVWGDRQEVKHTGNVTHTLDASKLSKKQLKLMKKFKELSENEAEEAENQ